MTSNSAQHLDIPDRMPHMPKYYWLHEILREQISQWEIGHPLPSESELCRTYSVSRTTVRKAIDELAHEGLSGFNPAFWKRVPSNPRNRLPLYLN
jgi:DNA-binding GntR family transcriptional regulator